MANTTEKDEVEAYLTKLATFNEQNPIMERGDVATLKRNFDGDWEKFIYAWALREPPLVNAHYSGGFGAVEEVGKIKYEFIPKLAIRWMKPEAIQQWDNTIVKELEVVV